jgi:TonB family protein
MLSTSRVTPGRRRTGTLLSSILALSAATLVWAGQPETTKSAPSTTAAAGEVGPTYRSLSPPTYPAAALEAGQEGKVILKVLVDTDGSAKQLEVASASLPGVFDEASIATVRKWKFNPAVRDGQPVEAWVQVPICFSREEDQTVTCSAGPDALDGIYRIAPKLESRS